MSERLVHLVYIHGFRGDETTFQTFPTHLQQFLTDNIPSSSNIKVQSSVYPTYKSKKPISFATRNFIEWLRTQPPGPVILLAHSMGGLLAAEAATDLSNTIDGNKRIVGMIAFDCPYLGMHPHVVITGVASLLPKKHTSDMKTETELNPHLRVVDQKEIDSDHSPSPPHLEYSPSPSNSSSDSLLGRTMKFVSSHSNHPVVRWARKHSDEPFTASKRWVAEHFQFGSCMFDPSGLKDRYTALVAWNGLWVNYWTVTAPKSNHEDPAQDTPNKVADRELHRQEMLEDNDAALVESGIANTIDVDSQTGDLERKTQGKETRKDDEMKREALQKESLKTTKSNGKVKGGRHFVVFPTGLGAILGGGDKWEKVVIGGVDDEVAAHCGLFVPHQNLDYTGLVERVGLRIIDWCSKV